MAQRQDYVGGRYTNGNGNGNGHHSPEQIKRQVDHTRAEMDATIDALIERLDPAAILSKTVRSFVGSSSHAADKVADKTAQVAGKAGHSLEQMGENLLEKARENPIPTAMIALGAAWLFFDRDRPTTTRRHNYHDSFLDDLDETPGLAERSVEAMKGAGASAKHGIHEASEHIHETAHDAAQAMKQVGKYARRQTRRGIHRVEDGYELGMRKAPLAMGGIALGIGLLCGVLIPETEAEDQWMGETRDDLMRQGEQAAKEMRDRGLHAAAVAADAASETLQEEGLGPQEVKQKLTETAEAATASAKQDWKENKSQK
ncbi:DUF3618 domain-containing protein [Blastopirellula marina]|uniref:DUF3618 domain-containing protein n=1 Tax=Blastopirellula marina TaxID=124 RepID=A0A2S8FHK1_9BACT|nr:DUF3618 domain-containing protein [Blastopirellula marina]PQO31632.1 hypothetical protein C5Y98_19645 [Blastopirellula marina]PTL42939.1 DUF3618 domain-containing protein [Blastopirellula marina]